MLFRSYSLQYYSFRKTKALVSLTSPCGIHWDLGHDIVSRHAENKYGSKFYASISRDLQSLLPNIEGLSERNIRYCKKFYMLYSQVDRILLQVVAKSDKTTQNANLPQVVAESGEHPSIVDNYVLCRGDIID